MKNKLEIMLISLSEFDMKEERQYVIDALDLVSDAINTVERSIKEKMHECIDAGLYDRISEYRKTNEIASVLSKEITEIKNNSECKNPESNKTESVNLIKKRLDENMENQTPYKFVLDGVEYILEKSTFRCLFETIMIILSKKSADRFIELTKMINKENLKYCRFFKTKPTIDDASCAVIKIDTIDIYMLYQGNSNALCSRALTALRFFDLENKYELYLNGKIRNIRKKDDKIE